MCRQLPGQSFVDDAVSSRDCAAAVDGDERGHRVELLVEGSDLLPMVTIRAAEAPSSTAAGLSTYWMPGKYSRMFSPAMGS